MERGWKPLVLLLWALLVGPGWAQAQQAVQGYQLLTDPQVSGGHLVATRPGTGSATALLVQALKEVTGFFDGRPQAVGGARDGADQRAEVVFRATLRGSPVGGIAYAVVGGGSGTAGFVFDSPQTIRRSLPRLMQLAGGGVAGPAPAPALNWREVPYPDGSGSMRLPEGWVIGFSHKGMASAKGPQGWVEAGIWGPVFTRAAAARISATLRAPITLPVIDPTDPVTVLQAHTAHLNASGQARGMAPRNLLRIVEVAPAPLVPGYAQAAYIDYEFEMSGGRYRSIQHMLLGTINVDGTWVLYNPYVASPAETFAQNLPVLLEIWASAHTAQHVIQERLDNAMRSLREAGEIYRQTVQNRERSQQRMNDKWTEVFRGTRIVEDSLTGERRDVDLAWSKEVVRWLNQAEGTDRYREIPLWQLNQ
jgi:hypothetical protein